MRAAAPSVGTATFAAGAGHGAQLASRGAPPPGSPAALLDFRPRPAGWEAVAATSCCARAGRCPHPLPPLGWRPLSASSPSPGPGPPRRPAASPGTSRRCPSSPLGLWQRGRLVFLQHFRGHRLRKGPWMVVGRTSQSSWGTTFIEKTLRSRPGPVGDDRPWPLPDRVGWSSGPRHLAGKRTHLCDWRVVRARPSLGPFLPSLLLELLTPPPLPFFHYGCS